MQDPDKGDWEYQYNALGELTRRRDSKNQAIDFDYDEMGHVFVRNEPKNVTSPGASGTLVHEEITTWNDGPGGNGIGQIDKIEYFDNLGQPVEVRDFTYDGFGRVTQITRQVEGLTFYETFTYDEHSRVFQHFDASGDMNGIRYHYTPQGGYLWQLQEARQGEDVVV